MMAVQGRRPTKGRGRRRERWRRRRRQELRRRRRGVVAVLRRDRVVGLALVHTRRVRVVPRARAAADRGRRPRREGRRAGIQARRRRRPLRIQGHAPPQLIGRRVARLLLLHGGPL